MKSRINDCVTRIFLGIIVFAWSASTIPSPRIRRSFIYPDIISGVGSISQAGKMALAMDRALSGIKTSVHNGLKIPINVSCFSKHGEWSHSQRLRRNEWFLFDFGTADATDMMLYIEYKFCLL
ncbi:hypothetical protein WR25_07978 [Diploscapter pachys]|uniref:Uncharacterized protein n=1 Tax=Diploscapter pachys TaxID=2018661 RepID=A0A2A2KNV9_9BILA|nr:hypothetical protein WR25_07978 [Diploscapter pachys]